MQTQFAAIPVLCLFCFAIPLFDFWMFAWVTDSRGIRDLRRRGGVQACERLATVVVQLSVGWKPMGWPAPGAPGPCGPAPAAARATRRPSIAADRLFLCDPYQPVPTRLVYKPNPPQHNLVEPIFPHPHTFHHRTCPQKLHQAPPH